MGMLGVVAGHELTHRVKSNFDMFVGNWLLAFSWDCTFAIEHVHGHHKHACLPEDPASAKRDENIYLFILKAIINEHIDGWKIELNRIKKLQLNPISIHNRMMIGYCRSIIITLMTFAIGGIYLFDETFWSRLDAAVETGDGGVSITDVNRTYVAEGSAEIIDWPDSLWIDCGTPDALLEAAKYAESGRLSPQPCNLRDGDYLPE